MAGAKLEDTMTDSGPDHYYDPRFHKIIEDNIAIIRTGVSTNTLALKTYHAELYKGQFYSLLTEYRIPVYLHWITLRLNNLTSPHDYAGSLTILLPDFTIVENLLNTFRTRYKTIT